MTAARARRLLWWLAPSAWLVSFIVLARFGTWTSFAFVGVGLAVAAVCFGAVPRQLLQPSRDRLALGLLSGLLLVLGTHAAYHSLAAFLPAVRPATVRLLGLLNAGGFSARERAVLIVVIAGSEEILFRGALPGVTANGVRPRLRAPSGLELARVVCFAVPYALTTAPLGSALLVACAFLCGSVWGILRVATGSLVVPILTHVAWDLGVLLVWPLR